MVTFIVELGMPCAGLLFGARPTTRKDGTGEGGLFIFSRWVTVIGAGALLPPPPRSVPPLIKGSTAKDRSSCDSDTFLSSGNLWSAIILYVAIHKLW